MEAWITCTGRVRISAFCFWNNRRIAHKKSRPGKTKEERKTMIRWINQFSWCRGIHRNDPRVHDDDCNTFIVMTSILCNMILFQKLNCNIHVSVCPSFLPLLSESHHLSVTPPEGVNEIWLNFHGIFITFCIYSNCAPPI